MHEISSMKNYGSSTNKVSLIKWPSECSLASNKVCILAGSGMYHAKCSMAAAETYVKTYVIHFDILKALCPLQVSSWRFALCLLRHLNFDLCLVFFVFLDKQRDRPHVFLFILRSPARQQGTRRQRVKVSMQKKREQRQLLEKKKERRADRWRKERKERRRKKREKEETGEEGARGNSSKYFI